MTSYRIPSPLGGDPIEVTIADDLPGDPPGSGWRAPIVEWPHPDGSAVILAVDYADAVVYVETDADAPYANAWIGHHLAIGAPARARTGATAAAWRTVTSPSRWARLHRAPR